jgi:two-component system sensor histidine kinase KdpD
MHNDATMPAGLSWVGAYGAARDCLSRFRFGPCLRSLLTVAAATGASAAIDQFVDVPNLSLVFLIGVLVCASRDGLVASLFASVLSVLSYDFFFLPPIFHFDIADAPNVVAAIAFLISALLVSKLAADTRQQAKIAEHRAEIMSALQRYSGTLAGVAKLDELGRILTQQIVTMLHVDAALLLAEGERLTRRFAHPPDCTIDDGTVAAAEIAWRHSRGTARGVALPSHWARLFLPLRTERGTIGVLAIARAGRPPELTAEERGLLDALIDQTAVALERIRLAESVDEARLAVETERLRAALLRSISHDLRTPLSAILGAITGLRAYDAEYSAAARADLMATIHDEAERLNRFVGNLLDMTRLESGALELNRSMVYLDDVVGTALRRCAAVLAPHRVELELAADMPPLDLDFVLFEQVLANLLDNAAKYAAPGGTIAIRSRQDGEHAVVEVIDDGCGIPSEDLKQVFDPFYRVRSADRRIAGTGLGLAICRGFVEAMDGRIVARNRADRTGAVLTVTLPLPARHRAPDPAAHEPADVHPAGVPLLAPLG